MSTKHLWNDTDSKTDIPWGGGLSQGDFVHNKSDMVWSFGQSSRLFFGSSVSWQCRHRWEYNIKMDFQDVRWGGMDWIDLALYRDRWWAHMSAVLNIQVP